MTLMNRRQPMLVEGGSCTRGITPRLVGGKAWNLFQLRQFGFNIPAWCVVTSALFDEVVGARRESIDEILLTADYTCLESLEKTTQRIETLIRETFENSPRRGDLVQSLERWGAEDSRFAVRSSVVGEDSNENSFAGLMDSYLNVPAPQLEEFVVRVWASAFSARALAYRRRKGLGILGISAGVIIQYLIAAEKAGVLFSRDPDSGEATCVISAGYGYGEGVVGNLVEADTYRIVQQSSEITKEVIRKTHRITNARTTQGGTELHRLPHDLELLPVLSDAEILQLRDVAKKAEKRFRCPQDIEWAEDARGNLFILQSRPIMFASPRPSPPSRRIWDNSNIVESYPGLTSPMTFSFIRRAYEETFRNAAQGFFLSKKPIRSEEPIFKNMIGLIQGRVYYNLLNWYRMLSHLPGFKRHQQAWDQMIGISEKTSVAPVRQWLFTRVTSTAILLFRLFSVRSNAKRFFRKYDQLYARYNRIDTSLANEDEVVRRYEELCRDLAAFWHLTLYNDLAAMKYFDWLKILCNRWIGRDDSNLHHNLLCGEQGVESVKPVRSIVRIAEMIRKNASWLQLLTLSDEQAWTAIKNGAAYASLKEALEQHLHLYGDRGLEELKLERETFKEHPSTLVGLLRQYCTLGLSTNEMELQEQTIRENAEKAARDSHMNILKRLLFGFVLRNARRGVANRENMRFARTRIYGIVRRYFARLAQLFEREGILASPADFYYLTIDEVVAFIGGTAVTENLAAIVEIRKEEYRRFAEQHPDERIQTDGIPYLNSFQKADSAPAHRKELRGIGCSSGIVEGEADIVCDPRDGRNHTGQILVARSTDPGWVFLMIASKGIIVEKGSVLSHTAIIGRELGVPTVVGVHHATKIITPGMRLTVNGSTGVIQWQ